MKNKLMNLFLRNVLPVLLVFIGSFQAMSQDEGLVLRGKVTDKVTKKPLEGASVSQQDKEGRIVKSTSTDVEGNFVLRVAYAEDSVSVNYLGYKTYLGSIRGSTTLNIQLEIDATSQEEVIVSSQRRFTTGLNVINERDLTTTVGRISI